MNNLTLKYIKPYRKMFVSALLIATLCSGLNMVMPSLSGTIIDRVFMKGQKNLMFSYILIIVSVTFGRSMLRYLYVLMFESVSQRALYNIRTDMYRNLHTLDSEYYDKNRTGDIMARMTGDVDAIRHFFAWVIYQVYDNSLTFIFGLSIMFYLNYRFAFIILLFTIPTAYFARKLSTAVKPTFKNIRLQFSKLNTVAQENISGNRVVKAFAKEDYEIEKLQAQNLEFKATNIEGSKVWGKYLPLIEFFSSSLSIVTLLLGGYFVIKDMISIGELVTFNSLIFTINNPLRMSGWLINDIQRYAASADKVKEILTVEPLIKSGDKASEINTVNGDIEFKNVSFNFDEETVLKNINFKVSPGETIGIVGPTGSGKSTLVNLLYRFYDCSEGEILIDGVNIKNYNLQALRRSIGAAMQDIFLFSDTIEGNIAYGVPEASLEEVEHAARLSEADEFIQTLQDGYNTIIGERGVGLSGGQKQRIALARALIKNPSILVLDDTTSAVDMETEHAIQLTLNKYSSNRTTFIIAHRISSVKNADKILVLNDGQIIEAGRHSELIEKKGYYHSVYMNQFGNFDPESSEVMEYV
ncbi:MAG: ABC transporter ATP-binding protein [Bacillota bacterium]|nr:ABC transporter ATP-binding protein [Bacillota bacterium]